MGDFFLPLSSVFFLSCFCFAAAISCHLLRLLLPLPLLLLLLVLVLLLPLLCFCCCSAVRRLRAECCINTNTSVSIQYSSSSLSTDVKAPIENVSVNSMFSLLQCGLKQRDGIENYQNIRTPADWLVHSFTRSSIPPHCLPRNLRRFGCSGVPPWTLSSNCSSSFYGSTQTARSRFRRPYKRSVCHSYKLLLIDARPQYVTQLTKLSIDHSNGGAHS